LQTISILTPARRRPNNILRMLSSIKQTKSGEHNIEVIFRVDKDDELLQDKVFRGECYCLIDPRLYIQFVDGPATFPDLGCLWNECLNVCCGDILMCGGDDLIFETKDWDRLIVSAFEKFPDEIALVYGNDGNFGSSLATHPILSKKAVETVGWFFPPIGLTYANDNFIFNLYHRLPRLHFMGELSIRHQWDGTNQDDPNYGRMGGHFDRSHELLSSNEGQEWIRQAEIKLRKEMR